MDICPKCSGSKPRHSPPRGAAWAAVLDLLSDGDWHPLLEVMEHGANVGAVKPESVKGMLSGAASPSAGWVEWFDGDRKLRAFRQVRLTSAGMAVANRTDAR
jgi:hypothetical protein